MIHNMIIRKCFAN